MVFISVGMDQELSLKKATSESERIGRDEFVKRRPLVCGRSAISLATTVISFGISWNLAASYSTVPPSAAATVPAPQAGPTAGTDEGIYLQHLGVPLEVMPISIHSDGELQRQPVAADPRQTRQQATVTAAVKNEICGGSPNTPAVPYAYLWLWSFLILRVRPFNRRRLWVQTRFRFRQWLPGRTRERP
jgi:hypothetical protein